MKTHQFDIITIFPEIFESTFRESILKRAQDQELINIDLHDLREYTLDKHKKTDDYPFGGGVGLIMSIDPIVRAIETIKETRPDARSILLSPGG